MRSLINNARVVENISILLYSRTYDELLCEFYYKKTKKLLCKKIISTSEESSIAFKMPLNEVEIIIKQKNSHREVLDELNFEFQDFSQEATVEDQDHYVKLRKSFGDYTLLFEIFYLNSNVCTSVNTASVSQQGSATTIKDSSSGLLREIAEANMQKIKRKTLSKLFASALREKALLDKSLVSDKAKSNSKVNTKGQFVISSQLKGQNSKSKEPALRKLNSSCVVSQIDSHAVKQQNNADADTFKRKQKKNFTYNVHSGEIKRKKITFIDEIKELKTNVIKKNCETRKHKDHQPKICAKALSKENFVQEQSDFLKPFQSFQLNRTTDSSKNYQNRAQTELTKLFRLCQERESQKIVRGYSFKRAKLSSHNNNTQSSNFYGIQKVQKSSLPRYEKRQFYEKVYKKTLKSLQRQTQIINFAKNISNESSALYRSVQSRQIR